MVQTSDCVRYGQKEQSGTRTSWIGAELRYSETDPHTKGGVRLQWAASPSRRAVKRKIDRQSKV